MYERILAAVDESQTAERVLAAAQELATLSNGEVIVLAGRARQVQGLHRNLIRAGARDGGDGREAPSRGWYQGDG
jgi:nucleotide-binding universal stress UspA family protein